MNARVTIVQSYVPLYRVAFFEQLRDYLARQGVECVIAAGIPSNNQASRGDAAKPEWLNPICRKNVKFGKRSINVSASPAPWKNTDAVILGLEGSSLPVYAAMLEKAAHGVKIGLWGHVKPYVSPGNKIDLSLEAWQMRAADHVFAYTPGGREYALARGIAPEKVTTVMNSIDTTSLEASKAWAHEGALEHYAERLALQENKVVCFIGGLDKSKRIDFLAQALEHLWQLDPTIKVLIGGNGSQKGQLDAAFDRGQAVDLGFLDNNQKALAILASRAILMPGRIGLVAVDALLMRRPIITTDWAYHAPESEYLEEGVSRYTVANDPFAYAETIYDLTDNQLDTTSVTSWRYPTLAGMVENYANGVAQMLK